MYLFNIYTNGELECTRQHYSCQQFNLLDYLPQGLESCQSAVSQDIVHLLQENGLQFRYKQVVELCCAVHGIKCRPVLA